MALTLIFQSCQKETVFEENPDLSETETAPSNVSSTNVAEQNIKVINASTNILGRFDYKNEVVIWEGEGNDLDSLTPNMVESRDLSPTNDIIWAYVAEVNPLSYNGQTLSATHVEILGNQAFVSFNTRGEVHLGAVEVIDLSDRQNPIVTSQIFFENADVNSITLSDEVVNGNIKLWVALSHANKGAVLGQLEIQEVT